MYESVLVITGEDVETGDVMDPVCFAEVRRCFRRRISSQDTRRKDTAFNIGIRGQDKALHRRRLSLRRGSDDTPEPSPARHRVATITIVLVIREDYKNLAGLARSFDRSNDVSIYLSDQQVEGEGAISFGKNTLEFNPRPRAAACIRAPYRGDAQNLGRNH
jgi:hypothetical protein